MNRNFFDAGGGMNRKFYSLLTLVVALALALGVVAVLAACQPPAPKPDVLATASYNVPVHFELGGKKLVVGNGGTLEVQSGGILKANAITLTNQISASSVALTLDLTARSITATGTISTGAATHTGALDMMNNVINNIGNAGSDFTSVGGLVLANDLSVRGITATGTLSVNGASTFNQVMYAQGGIDTNAHDIVMDGDGHSWVVGSVQDEVGFVTGSAVRGKFYDSGLNVTGTVAVNSQVVNLGKIISGTVANNGTIAHGLGAAPTYAVCSPMTQAGLFTYTVYVSGTPGATNVVIGISDPVLGVPGTGSFTVNCYVIP
jgi:hypothetical protein